MGAATRRKNAKRQALLADILEQAQEPEAVQVPLQLEDGWFRGVSAQWVPTVLELWERHKENRQLWIYRIDKFWIKQQWETKEGNFVSRGDLIVEVGTTEFAKELWLNTVSLPQYAEAFKDQIEAVKRGENGCVQFWWLKRFVMCRAVSEAQKLPVNHWTYYPIVEVFQPDGTYEQSAVDMGEFMGTQNWFKQDPKTIESAAHWEEKVFADCIKCEDV